MPPAPMGMQESDAPTHVVGSQGRRGILPSAPGRPAAPIAGTGAAKASVTPVKNEEGKFPCPHCTKTYLHAKHLKRHLLRRECLLAGHACQLLTAFQTRATGRTCASSAGT